MPGPPHIAVMPGEVLEYLALKPGGVYVDCTLGAGGHSRLIGERLAALGGGTVFGFDKDATALELARPRLEEVKNVNYQLIHADFAQAGEELRRRGVAAVDGVVADLGVSSMQLDQPERGFSFMADGPLDMRMDRSQGVTAEQVVNQFDERELANLIFQFGEERRSRRVARAIVRSRPITTTAYLAAIVGAANRPVKSDHGRRGLHPATRTFQALRIYVNSEIAALADWLQSLPGWLAPNGRAVVISFHSLEDRPVKQSFRAGAQAGMYRLLTKHTVRPGDQEMAENPRARSAKLRSVERTELAFAGG